MKFYKQRITLNYQIIPGSHNGTKWIAKYPYSLLYAERSVNELKAIDVINSTDKIKHGELLICDEFQFVDLSYFHKWFIWHFSHISQPFKMTHLCYVQKQPERNDSGHAENAVKKSCQRKQSDREIFFLFFFWYFNNGSKKPKKQQNPQSIS